MHPELNTGTMIGIFKTNIRTYLRAEPLSSAQFAVNLEVSSCNVDIEDCDKVLRVVDMKVDEHSIIRFVQEQGFHC